MTKKFVFYFYFVGWDCLSAGVHACVSLPNIEIHMPFGFIRIGWVRTAMGLYVDPYKRRAFGIDGARRMGGSLMWTPPKYSIGVAVGAGGGYLFEFFGDLVGLFAFLAAYFLGLFIIKSFYAVPVDRNNKT